jgi:hypothetical protein
MPWHIVHTITQPGRLCQPSVYQGAKAPRWQLVLPYREMDGKRPILQSAALGTNATQTG